MISLKRFLIPALLAFSITTIGQTTYPKITGYFSVMHPIVTVSSKETTVNFRDYYVLLFQRESISGKVQKLDFLLKSPLP